MTKPKPIDAPRIEQHRTTVLRRKVVAYCRSRRTVKEVAAEFQLSIRTAANHLDALVKAEKLNRRWIWDAGMSVAWDAGTPVATGRYFYKKV